MSPPDGRTRLGAGAERLARWSASHARLVLACAAVVLALSLASLSRLHVSSSLAVMLGTHSRAAQALERVSADYQANDAFLLLVRLPERAPAESGERTLVAFAQRLTAAVEADPALSGAVTSIRYRENPALARFAREVMLPHGAFYLGDAQCDELLRRLDPRSMREQIARNEALIGSPGPAGSALGASVLRDPLRLFELVPAELARAAPPADAPPASIDAPELSRDGRALLVRIGAGAAARDYEASGRLVDEVLEAARRVNPDGLLIAPAGPAAIARDSSRVIRRDAIVSTIISIAVMYALFAAFYRRWTAGLIIGAVAAVGMLAGVGALALFMHEVSPLAATIAALLAGLGTDYGIHFLSHYEGRRRDGLASAEASARTAAEMAAPIATNCLTSIFGFISLWPSKVQMLSDFAAMGAAGLLGALAAVFLLMPAILALVDRAPVSQQSERASIGRVADAVSARPLRGIGLAIAALAGLAALAAWRGSPLAFEPDLTVMHPKPNPALDATDEVLRRFSGTGELMPVEVVAPSPEGLLIAAHDAAAALGGPACRAAGVADVIGLPTLLPDPRRTASRTARLAGLEPRRVLEAFDQALAASVFSPEAYRNYRSFLAQLASARRPPGIQDVLDAPGLAPQLFPSQSLARGRTPTRTVLLVRFARPLHDRDQRRAAVDAVTRAAASVVTGEVQPAGMSAVAAELEEATRDGLPVSIGISFALVLAWLALVFRRTADVLLALIPLACAATTVVLFAAATGQLFNPINSVAIPLLDGIAVDAGVFLVCVFRAHGSTRAQFQIHLRPTTHAVLLSVATTVTAFASLLAARTPAVASLGLLASVGIIGSGVGAILLLMPILVLRARR